MITSDTILIYDGFCNLCSGLVQFIIKRDKRGKIKVVPLQSEVGISMIARSGTDPVNLNSVLFFSSGKFYVKSSAILHLFRELGLPLAVLYGFIIVPAFIRDSFYDLVARYRYRLFGKRDTCMVPGTLPGKK